MTKQTATPLTPLQVSSTPRRAKAIADMLKEGDLDIDAPYQRGAVWTTDQQVELIHSYLMGIPIPGIILNDRRGSSGWTGPEFTGDEVFAVIDGKQRILATSSWFNGDLLIPASWIEPKYIGGSPTPTQDGPYISYLDLIESERRNLSTTFKLAVTVSQVGSIQEEALIFGLVNSAGTPQIEQTLDNARRIARDFP